MRDTIRTHNEITPRRRDNILLTTCTHLWCTLFMHQKKEIETKKYVCRGDGILPCNKLYLFYNTTNAVAVCIIFTLEERKGKVGWFGLVLVCSLHDKKFFSSLSSCIIQQSRLLLSASVCFFSLPCYYSKKVITPTIQRPRW